VVSEDTPASFKVMHAGRGINEWIGGDIGGRNISELPPDCSLSFSETISQALKEREPVFSIAHRVRDGMVATYEILALPMSYRWGAPVVAAYVKEREVRYNLVDAIFQSTNEGMLAFAAVRDSGDVVVDLQIVGLNAATARLLCVPTTALLWRRFSELQRGLHAPGIFERLLKSLETGQHDEFELTISSDADELHLKVSVSPTGDLLSLALTDIGDIKEREASFRLLFDGSPVPMCFTILTS
jgi:hypothetical protein